jgi:hypothetical protein
MYPIEYICTKEDTIETGINIEAVKLSKLKLHNINNDSESNHLNNLIYVGIWLNPTSKNINIDNIVVIIILELVIICAPLVPIFLPNNPDTNELNIGKTNIVRYIYLYIYRPMTAT